MKGDMVLVQHGELSACDVCVCVLKRLLRAQGEGDIIGFVSVI